MSETTTQLGGIGFSGALAILFIALKLTGTIHWSWLWVLAPIWIPFVIIIATLLVAFLLAMLLEIFNVPDKRRRRIGRYYR